MTKALQKWLRATIFFSLGLDVAVLVAAKNEAGYTPQDEPKFESKVNVVLVPVLVLDQQGHAVGNLTQRDFRIFDQGKQQLISGFAIEKRAGEYVETRQSASAAISGGAPTADPVNLVSRRFIAFLFDDVHLSSQELVHVRAADARMLAESLTSTDSAAVLSTSGRTNTGFTHDRAKLQDAILNLRPAPIYVGSRNECPTVDHYDAFMILNQHDPETLEAVADQGCSPRADAAWEMAAGEHGTHMTLDVIRLVVRRMGTLPGQPTLILISPGFIAFAGTRRSPTERSCRSSRRVLAIRRKRGKDTGRPRYFVEKPELKCSR